MKTILQIIGIIIIGLLCCIDDIVLSEEYLKTERVTHETKNTFEKEYAYVPTIPVTETEESRMKAQLKEAADKLFDRLVDFDFAFTIKRYDDQGELYYAPDLAEMNQTMNSNGMLFEFNIGWNYFNKANSIQINQARIEYLTKGYELIYGRDEIKNFQLVWATYIGRK